MITRAFYTTRCKNTVGTQVELSFASVEAAKSAPIPEQYESAFIPVDNGYHVYSRTLGWEFFRKNAA